MQMQRPTALTLPDIEPSPAIRMTTALVDPGHEAVHQVARIPGDCVHGLRGRTRQCSGQLNRGLASPVDNPSHPQNSALAPEAESRRPRRPPIPRLVAWNHLFQGVWERGLKIALNVKGDRGGRHGESPTAPALARNSRGLPNSDFVVRINPAAHTLHNLYSFPPDLARRGGYFFAIALLPAAIAEII